MQAHKKTVLFHKIGKLKSINRLVTPMFKSPIKLEYPQFNIVRKIFRWYL